MHILIEILKYKKKEFKETLKNKEKEFKETLENKEKEFRETLKNKEKEFKETLKNKEKEFKETLKNKEKEFKEANNNIIENSNKKVDNLEKDIKKYKKLVNDTNSNSVGVDLSPFIEYIQKNLKDLENDFKLGESSAKNIKEKWRKWKKDLIEDKHYTPIRKEDTDNLEIICKQEKLNERIKIRKDILESTQNGKSISCKNIIDIFKKYENCAVKGKENARDYEICSYDAICYKARFEDLQEVNGWNIAEKEQAIKERDEGLKKLSEDFKNELRLEREANEYNRAKDRKDCNMARDLFDSYLKSLTVLEDTFLEWFEIHNVPLPEKYNELKIQRDFLHYMDSSPAWDKISQK